MMGLYQFPKKYVLDKQGDIDYRYVSQLINGGRIMPRLYWGDSDGDRAIKLWFENEVQTGDPSFLFFEVKKEDLELFIYDASRLYIDEGESLEIFPVFSKSNPDELLVLHPDDHFRPIMDTRREFVSLVDQMDSNSYVLILFKDIGNDRLIEMIKESKD